MNESIKFIRDNISSLFSKSLSQNTASVSLDIGSDYIKAISLDKDIQNKKTTVLGFACEKRGKKDARETIQKALGRLPGHKKELALSMSGHGIVLRYVNLPIMSQEELGNAMSFELEKYIPFHKDEVNFDVAMLKKNKNTNKMLVLIAAAKKELIEEKIKLCRDIGYNLAFIDVDPIAIANYFEFVEGIKEGVCAVVNIGAGVTVLDVIEDGSLVLSRDIFIGGRDFTKKIADTFSKDAEEAEQMKIAAHDANVALVLEQTFSNLVSELKVSFDFYETQASRLIDKIFITGGSANLKGVIDIVKQSLGQEVAIMGFKPEKLTLGPSIDSKEWNSHFNYLTVALGIVLR